jgi:hypothetical protein
MHQMKFISSIILILFFIWLLPLGVFIKPSQEQVVCGGQRAVCMCSHIQVKVKGSALEGSSLKSVSASQKEAGSSSAGHYYLALNQAVKHLASSFYSNEALLLAYRNPSLKAIEHIPKA